MGVFYTDEANIIDITTEILRVSGSIVLTGSLITSGSSSISGSFTGSLFGTASWATNAGNAATIDINVFGSNVESYLLMSNVAGTTGVAIGGDADLRYNASTNRLTVGSVSATSLTGSLLGTASFATSASVAVSASYALTASFAPNYVLNSATSSFITNSQTGSFRTGSFTGSFTGSLFGTASWAINASTASFTPNALISASVVNGNTIRFERGNTTVFDITIDTGSGGSGTPGGVDTNIQFNSGSVFGGSNKFTYEYDNASQFSNRLYHQYSEDFRSNAFNTDFKGSYLQENTAYANKQLAGISHYQYFLPANSGATRIYVFDAQGGTPGNLSMHGFKCDYSLLLVDGSNNRIASRVGTLIGAWSYDTAITPVIQDTFVDGDQVFNELGTVVFTLVWNFSTIELQMDCTNVNNGDTHFNGLFTNFGNTL